MGFRVDLVAGVGTMMAAFIVANPTLLKRHFRSRPPSLNTDLPCSYLDLRPEDVHYAQGVRDRTLTPSIVFVDHLTENGETTDRMDALVDAFAEHLDLYAHVIPGTVWSDGTWTDESQELGDGKPAAATRFTFGPLSKTEGRN